MNSQFSGLDDSISDRRERERGFARSRRQHFMRAVISVAILIPAISGGACVAESIFGDGFRFWPRFAGALACASVTSLILMVIVLRIATVESYFRLTFFATLLRPLFSDRRIGWTLWITCVVGAMATGPLGAYEGVMGDLPKSPEIYFGGLFGGFGALIAMGLFAVIQTAKKKPAVPLAEAVED
ncbi:hypothetical protein [Zavarzinella formosa]|uniref:hypothetical protein n=1 Tax=Zavarzinella formosa TaxID=360055 RepID=UPI00035D8FE1|nr:hypothetical protein [Zavarzinella formosa]